MERGFLVCAFVHVARRRWMLWMLGVVTIVAAEGIRPAGQSSPPDARFAIRTVDIGRNTAPGDVNGDGRTDLVGRAISNDGRNDATQLVIAIGRGDGTFLPPTFVGVAARPHAIADLDKDGRADLVVGMAGGVGVLPGNGNGTFAPLRPVASFTTAFVRVADLNGDGHRDLAMADDNTLLIYPGRSDFTFDAPIGLPFAGSPQDAFATDVNKDGRVDLVVTSAHCCPAIVFVNRGNGLFTPTEIPATWNLADLTAADLNGDARVDVVATRNGVVVVMLGNGDGTFQSGTEYDAGEGEATVAVGDFTRDGLLDVATGSRSSVTILPGDGNGGLRQAVTLAVPLAVLDDLHASDVDGDRQSDLITSPGTILLNRVPLAIRTSTADDGRRAVALDTTNLMIAAEAPAAAPWVNGPLRRSANGHFLEHSNGEHFVYLADTGWSLFRDLNRTWVDFYLADVKARGFNTVQAVALWKIGTPNFYGDFPLREGANGKWDPTQIITTPGNNPAIAAEYDFWDHVDYVISRAEHYGLYLAFLPTWGNYVSGTTSYATNMSSNVFTTANAKVYGEFLGRRYGSRPNVIWLIGGDRSPVYINSICPAPGCDFRPVWRALAEGVGTGVAGTPLAWNRAAGWDRLLMTYHPRRRDYGSSQWFHNDAWLDVNGVESDYQNTASKITIDWNMTPVKPTVHLEARYEGSGADDGTKFRSDEGWGQRYQLYHTLFAGSIGFAYGNARIYAFDKSADPALSWQGALTAPGRLQMVHVHDIVRTFTDAQLALRTPAQWLFDGPVGAITSKDYLTAMVGATSGWAMAYAMNGRDFRLRLASLRAGTADAYWFNPRNGTFADTTGAVTSRPFAQYATGPGAAIQRFNPPGVAAERNDWLLKLVVRADSDTNAAPRITTQAAATPSTLTLPASTTLSVSAVDDGFPAGSSLTYRWTQASGPATASLGAPAPSTAVSFPVPGVYSFRAIVSDGALSTTSSVVTVTVNGSSSTVAQCPLLHDAYIQPGAANTGAVAVIRTGGSSASPNHSLWRFSMNCVPAGRRITAATVQWKVYSSGASVNAFNLHSLTRSWTEWGVTWRLSTATSSWAMPGAEHTTSDRGSTVLGAIAAGAASVAGTAIAAPLNAAGVELLRAWHAGTTANNGFLMKAASGTDLLQLYGSETGSASNRPILRVTYE
jgi:hypothetical protein